MNHIAQSRLAPVSAQDLSILGEEDCKCVVVDNPVEMAGVLSAASRSQARPFAVTMHERACFEDCDEKRDFWTLVLQHLETTSEQARRDGPCETHSDGTDVRRLRGEEELWPANRRVCRTP